MHRLLSTLETCFGSLLAMLKPRRHCEPRRELIQHSRRLGTILATCWTSSGAPKPPLNACAQRYRLHPITPMQFSISHCYYNEKTNMRRLRITGTVISPTIANPNGLHGRVDH